MAPAPTISLCMIAKNEEFFLRDCLASVQGVVSEIILVDTGSTDATVRIAEEAGAKVLHFPWCDDFAAARNVGLEAAQGSHILVLDADERLAPGMGDNLLKAASDPRILLGCLPLYNADSMSATPEEVLSGERRLGEFAFVPRLLRNLPQMRFERRVHETLTRGFNAIQSMGGGVTSAVGAALIHYGDVPSYRQEHAKDDRNERLLRKTLEEDPGDGEIAGYLVVQLLKDRKADEARAVGERHFAPFLERNDTRPAGYLAENMVRLGYALALVQTEQGAHAAAVQTLRGAHQHTPGSHPNLDYVRGLAYLGLATEAADARSSQSDLAEQLDLAERWFRAARAADGKSFAQPLLSDVTGTLPMLKLASVQIMRGDADAALAELPPAEGTWEFAVHLLEAEAALLKGDPSGAMAILSPYVDVPGLAPDWYALVHRALVALGTEADDLARIAEGAAAGTWLEKRRRGVLVPSGG